MTNFDNTAGNEPDAVVFGMINTVPASVKKNDEVTGGQSDTLPEALGEVDGTENDTKITQLGVLPTADELRLAKAIKRHPAGGSITSGKIALNGAVNLREPQSGVIDLDKFRR